MQPSRRPAIRSPHRPQPGHGRSPSASSTSSTSSSMTARDINITSPSSTIKLVSPTTPTQTPMSASAQGYFEPNLIRSHSTQPVIPSSPNQVQAAAYAMQASQQQQQQRKRSATAPSPASPPLTASIISSAVGSSGTSTNPMFAVGSISRDGVSSSREPTSSPPTPQQPHAIPHPPPQQLTPTPPPVYSIPTPVSTGKEKKESSSKMKLFSKPTRIGTPTMEKAHKPLPSPNKLANISSPMPWMTPSAAALAAAVSSDRKPSFSSMTGSTLTLVAAPGEGFHHPYAPSYSSSPPAQKEHTHKSHFLRPRRDKDHSGITFSSSSSNSKAISADGSSLYSFGLSSPSTAVFGVSSKAELQKSISGIDISAKSKKGFTGGHGGSWEDGFLDSLGGTGVINAETAWTHLRSRVLSLFKGEPLQNTVEDLNKLVTIHIKRCFDRRSPMQLLDDVRDLLDAGMLMLDPTLSSYSDDKTIPRLVEIWSLLFGNVLPYFEAVFLPLQQEFKGVGTVMSAKEAREFWGEGELDVRRLVLMSFRDNVVLPLHNRLRILFSTLTLDFSISQSEITHNAGRMLQCISVLSGVLTNDDAQDKIDGLAKTLKHNWLSRGRTGRNRRGFVGTRSVRAVG